MKVGEPTASVMPTGQGQTAGRGVMLVTWSEVDLVSGEDRDLATCQRTDRTI